MAKLGKKIVAKKNLYLTSDKTRWQEMLFAWKVFKEFIKGFRKLYFIGPGITVFGSARFKEDHPYYTAAREFGKRIAQLHFTTITGGGPGIMEAANRGAYENKGRSVGINIILPHEQHENPYLTESVTYSHFFTRKVMLLKYSHAFIIMPGGFGTMDEFFETITLIQTNTINNFPIVLFGKKYYQNLMDTIHEMVAQGTIAPQDLRLVLFTDSIDEAMMHIAAYIDENYVVNLRRKPRWYLLEKG